jgi:hypothetical protein
MENSPSRTPAAPPLLVPRAESGTRREFPLPNPPNSDRALLPSLGRLARGLSALFWGLPAALVICVHTARAETLKPFNLVPPLASTGLLLFGLWQLAAFQKQERVWRRALDGATVFALINFGLSPFLYWSTRVPGNAFFANMELVMMASGLLFLASLSQVLQRLGAMLPDEALRLEIRHFTPLNLKLLLLTLLLGATYVAASKWPASPIYLQALLQELQPMGLWSILLLIFLVLLPLAVTMALLWKTKEVILESVFTAR